MPKVSSGYFAGKRNHILDAARCVCMKKPLYEVTMQDIIEESGLSQGGIYRYYANLYDLLFALVDRETSCANLKIRADTIFASDASPETTVAQIVKLVLGDNSGADKLIFEIAVLFAAQPKLYEKFREAVAIVGEEAYVLNASAAYLSAKTAEGYFTPIAPLQDLLSLLIASIDGINRDVILTKYYKNSAPTEFDSGVLADVLAKQFILALGGDITKMEGEPND